MINKISLVEPLRGSEHFYYSYSKINEIAPRFVS
jgi:hypothetical protein